MMNLRQARLRQGKVSQGALVESTPAGLADRPRGRLRDIACFLIDAAKEG